MNTKKGFTLIELLIVIAVIAVLSTVVVVVLNPVEYLREARDTTRMSDLANINKALSLFLVDQPGGAIGTANKVYVSLPGSATGPNDCSGLGLPPLPTSPVVWTYQCAGTDNYRKTNGSGWLPVALSSVSYGGLAVLPIDPVNKADSGNYYTYVTGGSWALASQLESQKYLKAKALTDGGTDPARLELGSDLKLWAKASGLVGYWSFDEGSGTTAYDGSGNNNNLTIGGISTYTDWVNGKIGKAIQNKTNMDQGCSNQGAGIYKNDSISSSFINLPQNDFTVLMWVKLTAANHIFHFNTPYSCAGGCGMLGGCGSITPAPGGSCTSMNIPGLGGDVWKMYSYVFNLSSFTQRNYTNDSLSNTSAIPNSSYGIVSAIRFGIYDPGCEDASHGLFDEIRVYNRALSANEIKAIYEATK